MVLMQIVAAATPEHLAMVRQLFEEYWRSFGFTPCFQNFAAEVAGLPGYYAPPAGRLALAFESGEPAGCIALRPLDHARAEAKRLYVRPQFRARGLGLALLQWVIDEARRAGYREMMAIPCPSCGAPWRCTRDWGSSRPARISRTQLQARFTCDSLF
ncbi:MAG TPA: GNAT family N-acetyltransferase [Bryobacteraceae bacterium]|nr:GNAT family N-acetyltransferase [Bryobacteraceae bacterium]